MVPIVIGVLIYESCQKRKAKKYSDAHLAEGIAAYRKKWHMD